MHYFKGCGAIPVVVVVVVVVVCVWGGAVNGHGSSWISYGVMEAVK